MAKSKQAKVKKGKAKAADAAMVDEQPAGAAAACNIAAVHAAVAAFTNDLGNGLRELHACLLARLACSTDSQVQKARVGWHCCFVHRHICPQVHLSVQLLEGKLMDIGLLLVAVAWIGTILALLTHLVACPGCAGATGGCLARAGG
jgi:hypothetical protein